MVLLVSCGEQESPEEEAKMPSVADGEIDPAIAELRQAEDGSWQLYRDGQPFFLKGAGAVEHIDVLADSGANAVRTWGFDQLTKLVDGKTLIERVKENNLKLVAGIWVQHKRHGFDYSDVERVKAQREEIRREVAKWKNEDAILMWSVGNEMEEDGHDPVLWKELEAIARVVREEDPSRLIMTVTAGAPDYKVRAAIEHLPTIDILGVNAYAAAPFVAQDVVKYGWKKPFMLTEFGPRGHWEVDKTEWGAAVEPTSVQKFETYYDTHMRAIEDGKGLCVGTFAFFWGQKQERTPTWYSMFLPSGEKLTPVDAMVKAWTGEAPENGCPVIEKFESLVARGQTKVGGAS